MLEVNGVSKYFGGLKALQKVSFFVNKGDILGIIGPNGSGKTTLFNVINGLYPPDEGTIIFQGKDITNLKPHEICKLGIARTFQNVAPFIEMAVFENVVVGALFGRAERISMKECKEIASYMLDFVGLGAKKNRLAGDLTFAERRRLEIARALACGPSLILLDEPMSGLNPAEVDEAIGLIFKLRDEMHITVIWIEHVMRAIMNTAERIIVLNYGKKIAEGKPKEIASDRSVIEAYLGKRYT